MMEDMASHFRRSYSRWLTPAVLAVSIAALPAQAVPAEPAATIDLARYAGRWYVIARAPAGKPPALGAYFEYRPRDDGRIDDIYYRREGSLQGEPVAVERTAEPDPERPAKWDISTGWLSSEEQWVLYVSEDYRYALVGSPDNAGGWILAREPVIPEWSYAGLLARLAMQGYDVSKFRRVAQKPEQVGRPGFE
jgi:apolipoprotein D and lipocalin family protein